MSSARNQSRNFSVPDDDEQSVSLSRLVRGRSAGSVRRALGLALLLALPGGTEYSQAHRADPQRADRSPGGLFAGDDADPVQDEKRLRALNAERHKSLVSDTDKLLKLARQLDDEVKRDNQGYLDQAELTQAAEIEKLAHRVKEKMSTSVRSTMNSQPFPAFPVR